jgi:hypothetical protein
MKTLVCLAVLLCLSCAVLLAHGGESSAAEPQNTQNGTQQVLPCATPNPASGYAPNVKIPGSKREVNVYNVDYAETESHKEHNPVCLYRATDDTMVWLSGSSKKFKIKVSVVKDQDQNCGQHPFQKDPPTDTVDGYFSGSLKPSVPANCVYAVDIQMEGGPPSDPHIQTK